MKNINLYKIIKICFLLTTFIMMINKLFFKEWLSSLICFFVLIFIFLLKPTLKKFKINILKKLEIFIYFFAFATIILGEVYKFNIKFSLWDDLLHFIGGILIMNIGLFIISVIKERNYNFKLNVLYEISFSFLFTLSALLIWECIEFDMDYYFKTDMQMDTFITEINSISLNKDESDKPIKLKIKSLYINNEDWIKEYGGYLDIGLYDTMYDIIDGLTGAVICSLFSYFHIKYKKYYLK